MNEKLKNEFDAMFGRRFLQLTGNNKYIELRDRIINWKIESIPIEPPVGMPSENSFGQWISVKDKFPDEDIPVLVRVKKPLGEVGRYTVNRWTSYTDQNKEWFNKHFSHWMPLPKF